MQELIVQLKSVVIVILIAEFLKELLTTTRFQKYVHFALSLFLLNFFISLLTGVEISLPMKTQSPKTLPYENLLLLLGKHLAWFTSFGDKI